MTILNRKTTTEGLYFGVELVPAIKAVFAATHGRGMTPQEETELILPDGGSPFSISSGRCIAHETELDRYPNVGR